MYKAVKVNPGIRSGGVNRLGLGLGLVCLEKGRDWLARPGGKSVGWW
jgi:hypothetical protein